MHDKKDDSERYIGYGTEDEIYAEVLKKYEMDILPSHWDLVKQSQKGVKIQEKKTFKEKALLWAIKKLTKYARNPEAHVRGENLVKTYQANAENEQLTILDVKENGSPSKEWRKLFKESKKQKRKDEKNRIK